MPAAAAGYNVTILAYGQTGSGKTYTMGTVYSSETGMTEETGVIPRAMSDLFAQIAGRADCQFLVRVSFLEVSSGRRFDRSAATGHRPRVLSPDVTDGTCRWSRYLLVMRMCLSATTRHCDQFIATTELFDLI